MDYIAIFHLHMGAFGAAVATGLSQLLTVILYIIHFLGPKATFRVRKFCLDLRIYRKLLPIGFSDGVTELCTGVMIFLFNRTILRCIGTDGLVSYHYGKDDQAGCRSLLGSGICWRRRSSGCSSKMRTAR